MNNDLLLALIGLGVIAIIGVVFVLYSVKKSGDKKEAERFLDGLSSELVDMILDIIKSFKFDDFKDLSEVDLEKVEIALIEKIYDTSWNYVKKVVEKKNAENMDFFTRAVLSLLENKSFVENFIKELVENNSDIQDIIHDKAKDISISASEKILGELEEREEELTEEFSDQDKYVEVSNEEDLPVGEDEELGVPTEEELAELNPQKDEEEELDPENDPSVEVVDDDIYYDKSGRPRSKKTGKWVKVNE